MFNERKEKWFLTEALSINALHACVYIYNQQLRSFRAPTLWFMDLTVATCHIQYMFLSLCEFFSQENRQNTKILEVCHFCIIWKWPQLVIRRAKHWYKGGFFKQPGFSGTRECQGWVGKDGFEKIPLLHSKRISGLLQCGSFFVFFHEILMRAHGSKHFFRE